MTNETSDRQPNFVGDVDTAAIARAGNVLQLACHGASQHAGWWTDLVAGTDLREVARGSSRLGKALVAEKLCLAHSELSEAMEAHRKGLADDKIKTRPGIEVELADCVIRICDLAGALGLDLGGAIAAKMAFNRVRPDHQLAARAGANGKSY